MIVYLMTFIILSIDKDGNCWASGDGNMTPLFESPGRHVSENGSVIIDWSLT